MRGVFVAGTDTGVGKTHVGRALLEELASLGVKPCSLKPIETGCPRDAPDDALALRTACGAPHDARSLDEVCPYRFLQPAAPLVAAEAEGASIDVDRILATARAAPSFVLVEAAGGLLVPLARTPRGLFTNLDLAVELGLPVVLVARAGLGTINHSALSVAALRARGVEPRAVVLNQTVVSDDPTLTTNATVIRELTGANVVGPLPHEAGTAGARVALRELVAALR